MKLVEKYGAEIVSNADLVATSILGDSNARNELGQLAIGAAKDQLVEMYGEEAVELGETLYKAVTGDKASMDKLLEIAKAEARKILVEKYGPDNQDKIVFCEDLVKDFI